ncbi:MAG: hypothetical protein QQN46_07780, partial [Nitrosopumilus sp.]
MPTDGYDLGELGDVTIASPADCHFFQFRSGSSTWENNVDMCLADGAKVVATGIAANIDIEIVAKGTGQYVLRSVASGANFGQASEVVVESGYLIIGKPQSDGDDKQVFSIHQNGVNGSSLEIGYEGFDHSGPAIILDLLASNANAAQDEAVNYLRIANAATGLAPKMIALGSDSNVGIELQTKGSGKFIFQPSGGNPTAGLLGVNASGELLFNQGVSAETISLDELSDVALSGAAEGEFLRLNGSGNFVNVEIVEADISDLQAYLLNISSEDFTDLSDTPANYVGAGSRFVKVNSGETALEFVDVSAGVAALNDLSDVTLTAEAEGEFLRLNGSAQWVNVDIVDGDVPETLTLDIINSTNGLFSIRFANVASSVMGFQIIPAILGGDPALRANGTGSDIGIRFETKGTGDFKFFTANGATPVADGLVRLSSGTMNFAASVLDAEVPETLTLDIINSTNGLFSIRFANVASSVMGFQIIPAILGGDPALRANGTGSDIGIRFETKGTGDFKFFTANGVTPVADGLVRLSSGTMNFAASILDADVPETLTLDIINSTNGLFSIRFANVASSVMGFQIIPAILGGDPALRANGTGSDIGIRFETKGTGDFKFFTANGVTPVADGLVRLSSGTMNFGASVSLDELSDVSLSSPASGEFLRHNGSGQFVNVDIVEADISNLQSYLLNISSEDFTDLSDTPANYVGAGSRFV